ncbi:hypothetical protein [Maribacter sp. 2307ULW6-5]|uniref:hypothetical protein n=1 Tax=Maribacter sp. 2307ULW6-5 TaxID=3386275 RepID=UPI0039BC914B
MDTEEAVLNEPPTEIVESEILGWEQLPNDVRQDFLETQTFLERSHTDKKKGKRFGKLKKRKILRKKVKKGYTYTGVLSKLEGGLYYDNIVIQPAEEGSAKRTVIRYEPDPEWYADKVAGNSSYTNYSGNISVYGSGGHLIATAALEEGALLKGASKASSTGKADCFVDQISRGGFTHWESGEFIVTDIVIFYSCAEGSGGGNTAPGAPDAPSSTAPPSSTAAPTSGGSDEPQARVIPGAA